MRWTWWTVGVIVLVGATGCSGQAELGERRVRAMASAVERAESYGAYGRAEGRVERLSRGMPIGEIERVMGAFVAVETREGLDGKPLERRAMLIEGRLCVLEVSEARQHWLFGYDEGRVVFVGFMIELTREKAGDEWVLAGVNWRPDGECLSRG